MELELIVFGELDPLRTKIERLEGLMNLLKDSDYRREVELEYEQALEEYNKRIGEVQV